MDESMFRVLGLIEIERGCRERIELLVVKANRYKIGD